MRLLSLSLTLFRWALPLLAAGLPPPFGGGRGLPPTTCFPALRFISYGRRCREHLVEEESNDSWCSRTLPGHREHWDWTGTLLWCMESRRRDLQDVREKEN